MSTTVSSGPESSPSVTQLVSGIVSDVQDLGVQHLGLFRREIKEDVRKTTDAASSLAVGLAIIQVGLFLLSLMLVHLMFEFAPNLPQWGSFGIVGAVITAIGGGAVLYGIQRWKSINARETAQVMKDDAKWLTNSK